jgi:hypothetical protein
VSMQRLASNFVEIFVSKVYFRFGMYVGHGHAPAAKKLAFTIVLASPARYKQLGLQSSDSCTYGPAWLITHHVYDHGKMRRSTKTPQVDV